MQKLTSDKWEGAGNRRFFIMGFRRRCLFANVIIRARLPH
jgi:hypothetical protein